MQLALLGEGATHSPVVNPLGGINPASLGVLPLPDNSLENAGKGVKHALNVPQEGTTKNEGNKKQPALAVSTLPVGQLIPLESNLEDPPASPRGKQSLSDSEDDSQIDSMSELSLDGHNL